MTSEFLGTGGWFVPCSVTVPVSPAAHSIFLEHLSFAELCFVPFLSSVLCYCISELMNQYLCQYIHLFYNLYRIFLYVFTLPNQEAFEPLNIVQLLLLWSF